MSSFFFFNDTATTEIYTLSLHDALPICRLEVAGLLVQQLGERETRGLPRPVEFVERPVHHRIGPRDHGLVVRRILRDRKSTRLNSSHVRISYAVFCLKTTQYRGAHTEGS